MTEADAVTLQPFARPRFDGVRGHWMINAPERVIVLDEIGKAIVDQLTGQTLGEAIDALATAYDAPREAIAADVLSFVSELNAKGLLRHG